MNCKCCDQLTALREEKTAMQQKMKKLQDELEEQQRDNDELKFDYDRATKEVTDLNSCYFASSFNDV